MRNPNGNFDLSKADRVYHDLRRKIRELRLPPGAPLKKDEIADALGVSRAPVSEAITRLADEALVEIYPQHGSFVAPIRAEDVRESLFIRTALEVEAARKVAECGNADFFAALEANVAAQEEALESGNHAEFYELDEALHSLIFEEVSLRRVSKLLDAARAPLDRPRRISLPAPGRAEETLEEHKLLVAALRSGNPEFAAAAMRSHLACVSSAVERGLENIEAETE